MKRKYSDGSGNDSGSDIGRRKKKSLSRSPKSASGSPKEAETEKATQDDIFGDDLSISSEDEDDAKAKKSVIREDDDDEVARYDDEGGAKKLTIDAEVPKIQTDLGKEIHFVKLPNFLSVESRPFD